VFWRTTKKLLELSEVSNDQKMKNFLLLSAVLFFSLTVRAQEQAPPKWRYGMQAGGGLSELSLRSSDIDAANLYSPKSEFMFLFFGERRFNRYFSAAADMGVHVKGSSMLNGGIQQEFILSLTYLQASVLPTVHLNRNLRFAVGPEIGYLVSQNTPLYDFGETDFELGVAAQMNYRINDRVELGMRAGRGLTPFQTITFTDENGQYLGQTHDVNQYVNLFARVRLSKN
jgi:Outer membrane protein beta-barrel domain